MNTAALNAGKIPRINSVDILRGLVMIIMALDHVRDYVNPVVFDPIDMTQSNPALFWTRWITHICAPVFIFLAGTSASLWEWVKDKSKKELSWLLFSRGVWLMLVEIFIINPIWTFQLVWAGGFLQVIWAIGLSMVVLSVLIHLPWRVLLGLSLATIFIHNYFDANAFFSDATINGEGWLMWLWTVLHEDGAILVDGNYFYYVAYPLIPWFAVMALGYCFGAIYKLDEAARKKLMIQIGLGAIAAFFVLRGINIYGDPGPWAVQDNFMLTIISFFNTEKYPPSLLYLLMTLGPSMFILAYTEINMGGFLQVIWAIGLSMVVLSVLIHLPWRVLLGLSLATIFIHNYFDANAFFSDATINGEGWLMWLWTVLHEDGAILVDGNYFYYVAYPLIPWFAVMALGYCFGAIYKLDEAARKKLMIQIGLGAIAAFFVLRGINIYGDPGPWAVQDNFMLTIISFFNTEKYPPSLLYLLMTLGPSMFILAYTEKLSGSFSKIISIYGKVPFFYYILHLIVAHVVAVVIGVSQGFDFQQMMTGWWFFPEGYGLSLVWVYVFTLVVVASIYPVCKWYAGLKKRSKNPLLTYL